MKGRWFGFKQDIGEYTELHLRWIVIFNGEKHQISHILDPFLVRDRWYIQRAKEGMKRKMEIYLERRYKDHESFKLRSFW